MIRIFGALVIGLWLIGCSGGDSRTDAGGEADKGTRVINMNLDVGEHRDISLGLPFTGTYSVSSRALASVGSYNQSLTCTPSIAATEVGATLPTNVSFGVVDQHTTVLRVIGTYAGDEIICVQMQNGAMIKINITVNTPPPDQDIIDGSPIDPSDPGTGGGNNGGDPNNPPPLPDPNEPGGSAEKDPKACTTAGFYYVDDDFNDVEGKYGADYAIYLRSLMAGNVDSKIRIYYPIVTKPSSITYTNMGQYSYTATKANATVIFEMQLAHHLFGVADKKNFYVLSNGYCMRGEIPSSIMSPPSKKLVWVTQ